ncbi:MAG: class I SAM-dependent methyltransferase [Candidatus Aminicenantes bacterium]|nr:class I SAM-dependent methyltransferase [Candidatus Aminicenantes bacterium]
MGAAATERTVGVFRSFWEETGENFPDLSCAPSTDYYFRCERRLFLDCFPGLSGRKLVKTDLWDEAKNTRILVWAARKGARVFGLDISLATIREASGSFAGSQARPGLIASDLRGAGFIDNAFDFLYSMGTIEHFPESGLAVRECFRILKPGGLAVIGVPNKCDPFLRPLMVTVLSRLGLYAYGREKSFTAAELERMLRHAGFRILSRTGILFLPGWLRMAELWVHVRRPGWSFLFGPLVGLFSFLYFKFPFLRKHGYLVACLAEKPK